MANRSLIEQLRRDPSDGLGNLAADEIERLNTELEQMEAKLYCMCGSAMEDHSIGSGHAPVSMFDYAVEQEVERRLKAGVGSTT